MSQNPFLGVYVGNANPGDPVSEAKFLAMLAQFSSVLGGSPTYIDQFVDYRLPMSQWVHNSNWAANSLRTALPNANLTPVIGIPMATQVATGMTLLQNFQAIVDGADDAIWRGIVQGYETDGFKTIFLRLGWEMNAGWEAWGVPTAAEAAGYVAAFQHISTLVKSIPGINVQVVWNPADVNWWYVPTTSLYPGDKYVDVIASDLYSPVYTGSLYDWSTGKTDTSVAQWMANPVNREHYWDYPDANQWHPTGTGRGWGLVDAMNFATAHGKLFGLAETGAGGNGTTTGPIDEGELGLYLAKRLLAPGAPKLAFVNIWDVTAPDGNWLFSDGSRPAEAAGWAALAKALASNGTGPRLAVGTDRVAASKSLDLTAALFALVTPANSGDTETITSVSASSGVASVANGVVTYHSPASGSDTLTFTVTDQTGASATSTDYITVDPGPTLAAGGRTIPHGQTIDLTKSLMALVTPGLLNDTETITAVSAGRGTVTLGPDGVVSYTPPTSGSDTVTYSVTDETGNVATGTYALTVDSGPTVASATVVLQHNYGVWLTKKLLALVTPGIVGDRETITAISALHGSVTLGAYSSVNYKTPSSGTDVLTFTVTDQRGETATGTYTVIVDPGATLATGTVTVRPGSSTDLAATMEALITPGVAGDTETIKSVSARTGHVSLGANGAVQYTAGTAGTDTITYMVRDQLGDESWGQVKVTISASASTHAAHISSASLAAPASPSTFLTSARTVAVASPMMEVAPMATIGLAAAGWDTVGAMATSVTGAVGATPLAAPHASLIQTQLDAAHAVGHLN